MEAFPHSRIQLELAFILRNRLSLATTARQKNNEFAFRLKAFLIIKKTVWTHDTLQ